MRAKGLPALAVLAAAAVVCILWVARPWGAGKAPDSVPTADSDSRNPVAPGPTEGTTDVPDFAPSEPVPERKEIRPSSRSVAGRVLDESSKPASGATVRVRPVDPATGSEGKPDVRVVQTASDGSFFVPDLGDGPFVVVASLAGRGSAEEHNVPPDTKGIELRLPGPTGFAAVVLEGATGKAIPQFEVRTVYKSSEAGGAGWLSVHGMFGDGRFELIDLKPGVYVASVRARGYVVAELEGIEVRRGEIRRGLEIRMAPTATIRGTVVDAATSQPVAGAKVRPAGVGQSQRTPWAGAENVSREDGAFEVTDLVPGRLHLVGSRSDSPETKGEEFEVASGQVLEGVVLRLGRGGTLEGVVPGEGGRTWASARVFVSPEVEEVLYPRYSATADANGYFSIEGVAPGRYRAKALPGQTPEETGQSCEARAQIAFAKVESGRTTRVEFPGPRLACTLLGLILRDGVGVPGLRVNLWPASTRAAIDDRPWLGETGRGGTFEIRNAPPGEATLSVSGGRDGSTHAAFALDVPDAPRFEVLLRLPAGEIAGRVLRASDGSPIEGAGVEARAWNPSTDPKDLRRPSSTHAGPDGRFRLRDLAPGAYEIVARSSAPGDAANPLAPQVRGPIEVVEGSPADIHFGLWAGGRARVVVFDVEGRSVEGARVNVVPASDAAGIASWGGYGKTGWDGMALVRGLAPGRLYAKVSGPGFSWGLSEEKEVRVGEETDFRVEIGRGSRVRVRLTDERGERVKGGCTFTDARGRSILGTFVVDGLPAEVGAIVATLPFGEWTARAMVSGYEEESRPLRLEPGGPVEIVLRLRRHGSR